MTASANTSLQANFKLANGDLINVYGDSYQDFKSSLEELGTLAQLVLDTGNILRGASTVVDAGLTGHPAPAQPAPQAPAPQPQQQTAPVQQAQSGTPVPQCQHGQMVYKDGTKNGKQWSAYFCPQPQGQQRCDPIWNR